MFSFDQMRLFLKHDVASVSTNNFIVKFFKIFNFTICSRSAFLDSLPVVEFLGVSELIPLPHLKQKEALSLFSAPHFVQNIAQEIFVVHAIKTTREKLIQILFSYNLYTPFN